MALNIALCDDILEMIGKEVEKKREELFKKEHEEVVQWITHEIDTVGDMMGLWDPREEDEGVFSDQFFRALYLEGFITEKVEEYRRNGGGMMKGGYRQKKDANPYDYDMSDSVW